MQSQLIHGIDENGKAVAIRLVTDQSGKLAVNAVTHAESDWRGNYTNTWFLQDSATIAATAVDNSEIYESGDVSMYDHHTIENASPADGVTVQVSLDGTNWSGDFAITGVAATPNIATGEFGVIEGKFFKIRVLKNGTTNEVPLIRYAHSVK